MNPPDDLNAVRRTEMLGEEAECVSESGDCDACGKESVPIYAALDQSGDWIGLCLECTAGRSPTAPDQTLPH